MVIRRLVLVVAALAMIASACSDDDAATTSTADTTTTTTTEASTTTRAADAAGERYPDAVREAYLLGCTEEAGEDLCVCTIEEFEDRLSLVEFLELDESAPIIAEVSSACEAGVATGTTTTTTTTVPTTTGTTEPRAPLSLAEVVELSIVDLEAFWAEILPVSYGIDYEPIGRVVAYRPSTGNLPECGGEPIPPEVAPDNAFYCNPDDYVAWDTEGLFPDLYLEFGDFTVALVLAHEWGHAVQNRVDEVGPTIQRELQADCFAGAWTGAIDRGEREALSLDEGDIEEAMAGYLLFRDPPGTTPDDEQAHGSAFDRVNAFRFGVLNGVDGCREASNDFPVAFIPLTQQDVQTGGDLPFADTAPLLVESLEAYWTEAYPDLFGGEWTPVSATIPYLPSTGDLPTCDGELLQASFYANNVFYCPGDDYVAWDDETLFPALYQSIGDFAIGQLLAHEWATAAQDRAGLPTEGLTAELQADCLSGAFTAAVVPAPNPTPILLSAGDLDEAVAAFIQFGRDPELIDLVGGSAFERFDAFQAGFFNGPASCIEG
ncbi:MAG: neutral zinc metallopeptidase [Acidimicrobiia bacterium]|nr:neutral zinc metallopeptidase [Acidimicrobiia bacterium]